MTCTGPTGMRQCGDDSDQCFMPHRACDGINDCDNGHDETDCGTLFDLREVEQLLREVEQF